jgi:hypothetical protein
MPIADLSSLGPAKVPATECRLVDAIATAVVACGCGHEKPLLLTLSMPRPCDGCGQVWVLVEATVVFDQATNHVRSQAHIGTAVARPAFTPGGGP